MIKQHEMSFPDCTLCMNQPQNPVYRFLCGHNFCNYRISCVIEKIGFCPQCSQEKLFPGNQPPGYMAWRIKSLKSLPDYEGCGTIVITFNFQGGIQGPDHANPGERFSEIFCSAYLPNNLTEVEVCNLLRRTFHERLIFTLRRSPTIGEDNKIVLNGIELKTSLTGGPAKRTPASFKFSSFNDNVKKLIFSCLFLRLRLSRSLVP